MTGVLITARERHTFTKDCLTALFRDLPSAAPVVFVAAGAPPGTLSFLRSVAKKRRRFTLLEHPKLLASNESRRLGLPRLPRRCDVAFLENDVVVQRGWLKRLESCLREEDADIAAPVILEGDPKGKEFLCHVKGIRFQGWGHGMDMRHDLNHTREIPSLREPRQRYDAVEFHCLLIRRRFLDACPLAPKLDSLYAHLDLCFEAKARGAKVVVDPSARVVFANPQMAPLRDPGDLDSFLSLWSFRNWWDEETHFARKWGLDPHGRVSKGHHYWAANNKAKTFNVTAPLSPLERVLWKVAGRTYVPMAFKVWLEERTVRKVRRRLEANGKDN